MQRGRLHLDSAISNFHGARLLPVGRRDSSNGSLHPTGDNPLLFRRAVGAETKQYLELPRELRPLARDQKGNKYPCWRSFQPKRESGFGIVAQMTFWLRPLPRKREKPGC